MLVSYTRLAWLCHFSLQHKRRARAALAAQNGTAGPPAAPAPQQQPEQQQQQQQQQQQGASPAQAAEAAAGMHCGQGEAAACHVETGGGKKRRASADGSEAGESELGSGGKHRTCEGERKRKKKKEKEEEVEGEKTKAKKKKGKKAEVEGGSPALHSAWPDEAVMQKLRKVGPSWFCWRCMHPRHCRKQGGCQNKRIDCSAMPLAAICAGSAEKGDCQGQRGAQEAGQASARQAGR